MNNKKCPIAGTVTNVILILNVLNYSHEIRTVVLLLASAVCYSLFIFYLNTFCRLIIL